MNQPKPPLQTSYYSEYLSAKIKWGILRVLGWIFFPWTSSLSVRVYMHYQTYPEFCNIFQQALDARAKGINHIVVQDQTPKKQNVSNMNNFQHLRNKRKPKDKK